MGKQLTLENYELVSISKDDAFEMAEYFSKRIYAIDNNRWHHENPNTVAEKAKLKLWVRMLKRLA